MAEPVNVSELARILGVSRVTVNNAIKAGSLKPDRVEKSGPKFDPDEARLQWAARGEYGRMQSRHRTGGNRGGRPKQEGSALAGDVAGVTGSVGSELKDIKGAEALLMKAKAIQARIKAERDNLELQRRKGELLDVEAVRRQGAELGGVLIGALAALPARLADQLSIMTDPREIHELLDKEANEMVAAIRAKCGIPNDEAATPEAVPVGGV